MNVPWPFTPYHKLHSAQQIPLLHTTVTTVTRNKLFPIQPIRTLFLLQSAITLTCVLAVSYLRNLLHWLPPSKRTAFSINLIVTTALQLNINISFSAIGIFRGFYIILATMEISPSNITSFPFSNSNKATLLFGLFPIHVTATWEDAAVPDWNDNCMLLQAQRRSTWVRGTFHSFRYRGCGSRTVHTSSTFWQRHWDDQSPCMFLPSAATLCFT